MTAMTPTIVETGLSDSPDLVAQAQAGDIGAFDGLCRVHGTRLLRQATVLCVDPALAEDLAQDTFLAAWKGLHSYHGRCQFFTWLCAILLNRHRNFRRHQQPLAISALADRDQEHVTNLLENLTDGSVPPDRATAIAERAAWLRRCLEQLPPKHREVIHLRFYVDHSLEGIAAALDCPVGTVKSRLFHAVERLRAMNDMDGGIRDLNLD